MKRIVLVVVCVLALATTASAQNKSKGWIDVNLGVAASAGEEQTFTFTDRIFSETRAFATVFPKPSRGASFDFGGGYMITPVVGVGVSFSGQGHMDEAGLGVTVPHPFLFNRADTDAVPTADKLTRAEGAVNIQAMFVPVHSDKFRVRLFVGPSYFNYKADMVSDIDYSQSAFSFSQTNIVTITGYQGQEAMGNGWGFHGGGDVSWFFSRIVGIGGFARYLQGTVTLDPEPLSETSQDVKVGGFHVGGGLRLRF